MGPNASNSLGVFSLGDDSYTAVLYTTAPIDLSALQADVGGIEVWNGSSWIPADAYLWDDSFPSEITFSFGNIPNVVGMPYRLVPPVNGWTVGGAVINPTAGTIAEPPEMFGMRTLDEVKRELLLRKSKSVK